MKKNYFNISFLCLVFLMIGLFSKKGIEAIEYILGPKTSNIIVAIDAGHGGFDPGKVGVNNALEKDINLSIAYKVKELLEDNDIKAVMTRKDDKGLYEASDYDKKRVDMRKRVSIINSSNAMIAISIHQNSFSQESSSGAQVFYYHKSEKGKILAEILQDSIKGSIKDGNHRMAKPNSNYYMLKYTGCPFVIVECGFLSNWREANLLCDESYQDKMAWAIHLGILKYIHKMKSNESVIN